MSRAPPRGGDSRVATSDLRSQAQSSAAPRARARGDGRLLSLSPPHRPTARYTRARRAGDEERDGEPHPGDDNRKGSAAETAPRGRTGRAAARARDGLGEGEREGSDGALRARPETATEEEGGGRGRRERKGSEPPPSPALSASRARQHGTVPPRYPPADSRPRGGEAGGEARASPPLLAPSSLFLSRPSAAPFDAVSRSPRGRRAAASAARPRRGRAPPQRLAPGAGSYGALPESAFRGTKALRGGDDDDRGDARRAAGKGSRPAEGNASLAEPLTAFPPGTGGTPPPPPPPPAAGDGPARRPQPRRRGGPRTAIDRQATLRQATRGRAPGFDRTSTQKTGREKKKSNPLSEGRPRGGGARAPDRLPPRGETPTSPTPSFGGGPGARARPGLRAEGRAARAGTRGGTAARPLLAFTGRRARHTRHAGRGRAAVGPRAAPALPSAPTPRAWRGAPPRRRAAGLSLFPPRHGPFPRARDGHATTTGPLPARLPRDRSPAGRASDRRTRSAAGPGGGRHRDPSRRRQRPRPAGRQNRPPPGPHARDRRRRLAPPGPLASGTRPAEGATGAEPGGNARSPRSHAETGRGGAPPRPPRAPSCGPHAAAARATEEATSGARDGTAAGRRRAPSGRPSPQGGTPVERRRRRSPRGRPRSRASAAGGPAERSPPTGGRAFEPGDGRRTDGAAAARSRRKGRRGGGEAPDAPDAAPPRAPETAAAGPGVRARAGPGGRHPAAEEGAESARSLPASPVTTRRAGRPPRPTARRGLSAEAGPRRGGGRAPLPGAARLTPTRGARRGRRRRRPRRGSAAGGHGTTTAGDRRE
ncbi:collagen, type I, alpha 1a-like [Molothrus aeneus]|uniref:collagen, type I, alpha 1a-like n=1 Tax=Molothrus aeneus TaxID=84833 RepID=UPI0034582E66